eukprot:4397184-Amphidinium_carterae.1
MQTSINRFTVKLSGGASGMQREDELALKRESECRRLGIQWPRPTTKVGRPSKQLQYEQAIYKE